MKSKICDLLGIEFPLFAFSHCRDVVAEVSKAGGFGVLGGAGHTPESLDIELNWIDSQVNGAPYGVDIIVPTSMDAKEGGLTPEEVEARIPPEHKAYVERILAENGVDAGGLWNRSVARDFGDNMREKGAAEVLDAAFSHPIKFIVNALGMPPPAMMERARAADVPVGALVGAREHAIKHAEAGVDVLVVAGTEAGGHCGEVSTLVLVPEVVEAVKSYGDLPVLAAGGIVTGRQMAACMAMGAAGAWTGSVWLTTAEAETTPSVKEKMLTANSRQTVRSPQPHRQIHSSASLSVDRRLANRGCAGPLADALAELGQRTGAAQDRQARRRRRPGGQAVGHLLGWAGRGPDERLHIRAHGGVRLHGGLR